MRRQELTRFLVGGLCGVALMLLGALALEALFAGVRGIWRHPTLVTHSAEQLFGSYPLAALVQTALCFALGGMAGLATLPFAEDGGELAVRSVLHFSVTALLFALLMSACFGYTLWELPQWLGTLLTLYLTIWLGRYVGWYWELLELRDVLGLSPGSSPQNWRETLPYLPFLAALCLGLPLAADLLDPLEFPILSRLLVPCILPAGCFAAGMSLGKRKGWCPLYVGAAFLLSLPALLLSGRYDYLFLQGALPILAAAMGHGLGMWKHRRR